MSFKHNKIIKSINKSYFLIYFRQLFKAGWKKIGIFESSVRNKCINLIKCKFIAHAID